MEHLSYKDVNREILRTLSAAPRHYYLIVALLFLGILWAAICWGYQILTGLGVTGLLHPTMWILYLVNFVFWIGIAHSGTLISAILYLFRARWRTAIARSSEAMTVFAVMIAGLFVFIHLGRPWIFYWIIPYPNERTLWPDFQSPLIFDFLAVSTYLTVSVLFWFTGLVPDLAAARDRARGIRQKIYGFFSLGWTGTDRQWHHYGAAYLLLAGLATPLVVSVHSVVSWDFALAIIPGYHSTIFAPYFVAGAIHSGLAMVLTLLIPLRRIFRFEKIITLKDLESIAKTTILTGLIIGYSYIIEYFMAWYSGNIFERQTFIFRAIGHYSFMFWLMVVCNAVAPLFFFFKKIRTHPGFLFTIAVLINIGMWTERFVIIIGSMAQDFIPYQWGFYSPRWVELSITVGSFCLFLFLFLLFAKFLPSVSIAEVKEDLTPSHRGKGKRDHHGA
ncbi:MAG: NrfD/PsrC family molybdoenzyme membrane anchor subunit [Thermodesulfobacteriota bacterium]|jgi:molybdopterin-containing oxidoreductase family membrane subunit